VIEGSPNWTGKWNQQWYGVRRFFGYLESKAYKMHIRVLLSKYRSYTPCEVCGGARLKRDALLWRLGSRAEPTRCSPRMRVSCRPAPTGRARNSRRCRG
jgi:excinuclease ABC subunit A